jgi:hypothetical protein
MPFGLCVAHMPYTSQLKGQDSAIRTLWGMIDHGPIAHLKLYISHAKLETHILFVYVIMVEQAVEFTQTSNGVMNTHMWHQQAQVQRGPGAHIDVGRRPGHEQQQYKRRPCSTTSSTSCSGGSTSSSGGPAAVAATAAPAAAADRRWQR